MRTKLFTAALILTSSAAFAEPWTVDLAKSTLTFEGKSSDGKVRGSFKNFTPEVDFSEQEPQKGRIRVTVDMLSATTEDKKQTEALPTPEWFNSAAFPRAEFASMSILRTGSHAYAATGTLTIRGVSKQVTIPFTMSPEDKIMHAKGEFELNRHDFAIGSGEWDKESVVAYSVKVKFDLAATPKI